MKRRNLKSKKLEFITWGSKPLIEFLQSIGKDTSRELKQDQVAKIIDEYIKANDLANPVKEKEFICDQKLQAIFGEGSVPRRRIYNLLEAHYAGNQDGAMISCVEGCQKAKDSETPHSYFAAIIPENIKLVYLRMALVQGLAKTPDMFEVKLIGSFVRFNSDPKKRNSFQLHQITGVKLTSEVHLQLSNNINDVPLHMLSDENFSEGECEDLCRRIKDSLLKRPTKVELEEKAKMLHEDITKHEIQREIAKLQNRIDHYNIKGRRCEMFECLAKRKELQQSSELEKRLSMTPKVIADKSEPEARPFDYLHKEEANSSSPNLNHGAASNINRTDFSYQIVPTTLIKELYVHLVGPASPPAEPSGATSSSKGKSKLG